jgi:hypothetical protein
MELWSNPETSLPIRIVVHSGIHGETTATFSDFVFNTNMDESLFSVVPPAGYTVNREKVDRRPNQEKDLVEMFREYTKLLDGEFPQSLDSRTVTWMFWKTYNIRGMWDNFVTIPGVNIGDTDQRRVFEERIGKIMDEMNEAVITGKMDKDQTRVTTERLTKAVNDFIVPRMFQSMWETLAPPKLKVNEELRKKFESRMREMTAGNPDKAGDAMCKILEEMICDAFAPAEVKADPKTKKEFADLVDKMVGPPSERQSAKEKFVRKFGNTALTDIEAWQKQLEDAQKSKPQKSAAAREAESKKFMDAQRQIGRGLDFVDHLSPDTDAHYVGAGVSIGSPDTPVFWYRPHGQEKYRVIYADLSVHEADLPPNTPNATHTSPLPPKKPRPPLSPGEGKSGPMATIPAKSQ